MTNKKKILSIFAVTLIVGSLFASKSAYAASNSAMGGNFFSGLITFISQKFGLDKTQVQSAVQDYRKQKKTTITPEKKRLDNLVTQGKITLDQENAIIAELKAIKAKYKLDPSATPEQRKAQVQNVQNELKTWAQSQGINFTYVMPIFGQGRGLGKGSSK